MHQWQGLLRSIAIYYGNPFKLWHMRRFYAQFIRPGDLCFDIGAHVGNRLWAWRALGAQVVGVEPQPLCMALLRRWYGRREGVTLVEEAVGATPCTATLWISERNPTVTTLSQPWINAVQQVASFATVQWETQVTVNVTTLDDLILRYGEPVFCKIDVEGYELEVLQEAASACIKRLRLLDDYEFNWSVGEQHRWQATQWVDGDAISAFIAELPATANSGDIYARRKK
jgi:FkbM family methyltransferase